MRINRRKQPADAKTAAIENSILKPGVIRYSLLAIRCLIRENFCNNNEWLIANSEQLTRPFLILIRTKYIRFEICNL